MHTRTQKHTHWRYHISGNWQWMDANHCIGINATVGGSGMLIGPRALKTLNSIERIQTRMLAATFNDNPSATIMSCYSPTNTSEETELVTFYDELSSLVRSIPKKKPAGHWRRHECPNREKRRQQIKPRQHVKKE